MLLKKTICKQKKKKTFWKILTCILDEELVLSEHQGRTTPPPAKKSKQEIVNSSTVSPYWLEFVQYLNFRLVIKSKEKKFRCISIVYFFFIFFLEWPNWISNLERTLILIKYLNGNKAIISLNLNFLTFGLSQDFFIWSKKPVKILELWIGLLKWLSPMWGVSIKFTIQSSTLFQKTSTEQYDAVLLL